MADSRLEDQPLAADTFARLPQGFCALVTGASGGIGRALIAELLEFEKQVRRLQLSGGKRLYA